MNDISSPSYWDHRYRAGQTGWDIGYPSPPLKSYIDNLENKKLRILIPGCGNAYEAEYLLQKGFEQVTLLDISSEAIGRIHQRLKNLPPVTIVHDDLFQHKGAYDLILEQTFFCSLPRPLRKAYAQKMHELLVPGGRLAGVLFNREFEKEGPPFGGNMEEYRDYFRDIFQFRHFEKCYNSIKPREETELFIELIKV